MNLRKQLSVSTMTKLYLMRTPLGLTPLAITPEAPITSERAIDDAIITPFASNLDHRMPKTQGGRPALGNKTVYEEL